MSCSRTGEQTFRHKQCCEVFARYIKKEAGLESFLETPVTLRHGVPPSDSYVMDITITANQIPMPPPMTADGTVVRPRSAVQDSGNTGLVDWSLTNPTAATYRSASARTPGHAAEARSRQKYDKYLPGRFSYPYSVRG